MRKLIFDAVTIVVAVIVAALGVSAGRRAGVLPEAPFVIHIDVAPATPSACEVESRDA